MIQINIEEKHKLVSNGKIFQIAQDGIPPVNKFENSKSFLFFLSYFGSETSNERTKKQQEIKEVLKNSVKKILGSFFCFFSVICVGY